MEDSFWFDDCDDCDITLPHYATGLNTGQVLKEGTQLLTKDGRKIGNARIMAVLYFPLTGFQQHDLYIVKTDIGNTLVLSAIEVEELFYIGDYFIEDNVVNG